MHKLKERLQLMLERTGNPSAEAEAQLILFYLFKKTHPTLKSFSDLQLARINISEAMENEAVRIASLRATGQPLQHILGVQFFLNHEYKVNSHVLVPRPETEILVQQAIDWIKKQIDSGKINENFCFAELGLGSGIISSEILFAFPKCTGVATELSPQAIAVARENLNSIIGSNWLKHFKIIETAQSSVGFEALNESGPYDLILSNPPYVSRDDQIEPGVLKHEPHMALFPKNPNFFYENFLEHSRALLKPGGAAFFEVPHERADLLLDKFKAAHFERPQLISDLNGRPRVLFAQTAHEGI